MSFCGGTVSSSVSPMTLVSSTVSQTQDKIQRPEVNNNNNGNRVWSPDSTPTTWMVRPVCNGLGGRTQYKNGAIVVSGSGHSKIGLNHGGNQKNSKSPDSKIVILGNRAVGKSALVVRFLTRRYIWEYDSTLECTYRYNGMIDDEPVCLDILDTTGQGDQLDNHIRWGDGFMLTYSVTDRSSFEAVTRLHRLVLTSRRCQSTSFVLVGNKNDLSHQRRVTHAEGEQLALELGCTFFEVSACDGDHDVFEAFYELHRDVSRRRGTLGRLRRSSAQQVIHAFNKMFTKMNV